MNAGEILIASNESHRTQVVQTPLMEITRDVCNEEEAVLDNTTTDFPWPLFQVYLAPKAS